MCTQGEKWDRRGVERGESKKWRNTKGVTILRKDATEGMGMKGIRRGRCMEENKLRKKGGKMSEKREGTGRQLEDQWEEG